MDSRPLRFIAEPVQVEYDQPVAFEKTPDCPNRFVWREETFVIAEVLGEWRDYSRRGRMARNMRPSHAEAAGRRGSFGVGKFYFRVRTGEGRVFDLQYDRAPKDVDNRKGEWILFQELTNSS